MATAAFKSGSRRGGGTSDSNSNPASTSSPRKVHPQPQPQPPPRLRRSSSVSAVSRIGGTLDVSSEFLNKRDNPLYWATGGSPPSDNDPIGNNIHILPRQQVQLQSDKPKHEPAAGITHRGRSVTRNSGKKEVARSLSRVVDAGRRGRSVSRGRSASQIDRDQELIISSNHRNKSTSSQASSFGQVAVSGGKAATHGKVRSSQSQSTLIHPSVDSSSNLNIPNWEDEISTASLSEAEEKTIKAVYEQMKSLGGDRLRESAANGIYETIRSEVRRAISDIHIDLDSAIRRNNATTITSADIADIPPDLVKPGAVELVLDIRREYARKLEESQERARKLRTDLAVEEHRGQELSRILKETLPDPKISNSHRSRLGRKSSSERKKMSKRLTDEAMSYFDECVSISTFDSSDFSATEDLTLDSASTPRAMVASRSLPPESANISDSCGPTACLNNEKPMHNHKESSLTASSSCNEPVTYQASDRAKGGEFDRKFRFSFGPKQTANMELQEDIQNYIRNFGKDVDKDGITSGRSRFNSRDMDVLDVTAGRESLLFDKVLFRNRIESGSLHICGGGVATPFLPFASLI